MLFSIQISLTVKNFTVKKIQLKLKERNGFQWHLHKNVKGMDLLLINNQNRHGWK